MFNSNLLSAAVSSVSVTLVSFSVFAGSVDNNQPANVLITESKLKNIEVIEVYAQKRKQNINNLSVAVSVIDGKAIARQQLKDTTQLSALVPNLKITNNAGEGTPPAFNIRGVGMIDYNTSTISPISIYADDVVTGSANNLSINLYDLEQVEVLRGPQGSLFGRNTTGGAILLRSQQPEKEFGGYINASVAQYDTLSLKGAVNLPISDTTAMRFAFSHQDYEFSTENQMPGQPDGGLKQTNLRLIVKSEFDDLTITSKFHLEDWSGKPKPIASLGINRTDGNGRCSPSQAGSNLCMDNFGSQVGGKDFWAVNADTADRKHDTESWGASVKLAWQLNADMLLTSISGYRALDRFHSWDSDGAGNFIEGSMGTDNTLFSQELSLAVEMGDSHWVSGLFYVSEDIKQKNDFDLFRDFRAIPELAAVPAQFFYDNRLENRAFALYSQIDHKLNQTFTLIAGLRYTDETTDYHASADLDLVNAFIPDLWDIKGVVEDDEFSGKLALNQKINNQASLYYSYSRGYKSGGYNAGYSTNPVQAAESEYAPEKLDAYEIGSYLQFWQQNARLHLAAFYYDYKDQQVFVNQTQGIAVDHVLKNAGDSTIYGFESELVLTPSVDWELRLNVGYLPKANMGSFNQHGVVVEDNRLPFASKWNISGAIIHEMLVLGHDLTAQLSFDFQSDFYFDQEENAYTQQTDFMVINGHVSYEFNPALTLTLWGKNLTNTEYSELRFNTIAALGAITELKAEARQLGIEASYKF
ncbi:TonB-dependent receptor [Colwellia sp. BRX10-3]|uniref:TonB-dependent receptor n=1 Tax=Colwellia sp. BRX10-3 TaxID=2759844 RepID=UPI0015F67717|nr:TonB-dependent receptor [Colwellia sp. BRX10-3]MBA6389976.1 TonB-dependent receptor [Colwellia sp. BRX10-3]